MMKYNPEESLISREASTALKGLLIFLIILGHNSFFSTESRIGMVYLYTFHIQSFFMLPFLYPKKNMTLVRIRDYAIRFYYPFIILFSLFSLLKYICKTVGIMPENVLRGYVVSTNVWQDFFLTIFTGNGYGIDYFTGFQFLWFLPVMFSMVILKDVYFSKEIKRTLKYIMFVGGFICFIMYFVFGFRAPYGEEVIYTLKKISPFAVTHALGAYYMGVVALWIIQLYKYRFLNLLMPLLFIVGTIVCFTFQHDGEVPIDNQIRWILLCTMPFIFFYLLYQSREFISKCKILRELGNYSFPIYIVHPLLMKILFVIVYPRLGTSWTIVFISQIIITIISYFIAKLIYDNSSIKAILFPNNCNELRNCLKKIFKYEIK